MIFQFADGVIDSETYLTPLREIKEIFEYNFEEENVDFKNIDVDTLLEGISTQATLEDVEAAVRNQKAEMIVHFPSVRVTNENDKYVDITHLWSSIKILWDGRLFSSIQLARSEYTYSHWNAKYSHSHLNGLCTKFSTPCFGTGPIKTTQLSLNISYDRDLWDLLCAELTLYVKTESLAGIPYNYLEKIGSSNDKYKPIGDYKVVDTTIKDFTLYIIKREILPFVYINGLYRYAIDDEKLSILLSNEMIAWFNRPNNPHNSKRYDYFIKCIYKNGNLYKVGNVIADTHLEGSHLFYFKGESVRLHFIDDSDTATDNSVYIIKNDVVYTILKTILDFLNTHFNYGTNRKNTLLPSENCEVW